MTTLIIISTYPDKLFNIIVFWPYFLNLKKTQSTFNALDATERKIDNLDFQTLSPEDRKSFVIALENLKQAVRNKLDTASQLSKNPA